ncbi:MAG: hypothetical protein K0A94_12605 [Desulfuromonadales bacterium]|nr:hypothetical protein [Desulfuromonadales bacterium]
MKNKKLTIGSLAASLLLGLAVTSFAGIGIPGNSPHIGTEAGVDIVAGEKAKTAAANFNYNAAQLAWIGTEAGAEVVASEKATIAAANFDYSAVQLAWIGTEAGYDPTGLSKDRGLFNTGSAAEQVAEKCSKDNALFQVC